MLIKQSPEDFIVEEVPIDFSGSGDYAIYRLIKKNYNTESAILYICKRFNIQRKNIKYAGNKDRNALTIQYISIFRNRGSLKLDNDNLKIEFVTYHHEPLSLGSLKANKFVITVRDVDKYRKFKEWKMPIFEFLPNYFDEQRFSKNNFSIGLAILKKDFRKAVELIDDKNIALQLTNNPNDYVGALRKIPKNIISIYIHSVQSFIFNESLFRILKDKPGFEIDYSLGKMKFSDFYDDSELPLIGFDTQPTGVIKEVMSELSIIPKDFIIKAIPELSIEQTFRKCYMNITDFSYEFKENGYVVKFVLPKGSYATIVIKALFREQI